MLQVQTEVTELPFVHGKELARAASHLLLSISWWGSTPVGTFPLRRLWGAYLEPGKGQAYHVEHHLSVWVAHQLPLVAAQCFLLPAVTQTLQVGDTAQKAHSHPGALLPTWVSAPPFGLLLSSCGCPRPTTSQVCNSMKSLPQALQGLVHRSQLLASTTDCTALQDQGGKEYLSLILFSKALYYASLPGHDKARYFWKD